MGKRYEEEKKEILDLFAQSNKCECIDLEFFSNSFLIFSEEKYKDENKNTKLGDYQQKHRYYYCEKLEGKKGTILFILFNPSNADPKKADPTIKNCRALVKDNYYKIEIVNIFSERNSKITEFSGKENEYNIEFLKKFIPKRMSENAEIVLAWGHGEDKKKGVFKAEIDKVENIPNLKEYKNLMYIENNNLALNKRKNQINHPGNQAWSGYGGFKNATLNKYSFD